MNGPSRKVRGRSCALSSPIRWIGGKGTNYSWIIKHFPEHECYVESFGGGASVLLNKHPSKVEVYNDLHDDLVHLFNVLRSDRKSKVLQEKLRLTLFHESEFKRCWQEPMPTGEIERARRIMVRLRMAFGGAGSRDSMPGFAFGKTVNASLAFKRKVDELHAITERLRSVTIMSRDALDVIKRFDSAKTLHYVDPPYVMASRKDAKSYRHEVDDAYHEQLAEMLNSVAGKVVLSGYQSDLYKRLYKGWRIDRRVQQLGCSRDKNQTREEVVWMNW